MKGEYVSLLRLMKSHEHFTIPVYQRNYDWKVGNCKQLYDDLIKLAKHHNPGKTHFFGSFVSVIESNGVESNCLIIDGQQRLTTVSLLLLAMYKLIKKQILISENPRIPALIYDVYLVDTHQSEEARIRLKPVKNDKLALDTLFDFDIESEYIAESNLTTNYLYFYNRIQKQEISIDELFNALTRLFIIIITLGSEDEPQLIFESLNSTGLELSEGDKIRNFILMGLTSSQQEKFYNKYWNPIEECTKYDVSSFVRDYLSVKQLAIPSQNRVYAQFKEYVEANALGTEDLLRDLYTYAHYYKVLIDGNTKDGSLDACIFRLNWLGTTVIRPFFLEVLHLHDDHKIDTNQMKEMFFITESYLFRRLICGFPTNALNKIFLFLHNDIIKCDGTCDNYVEKFKYVLLSKKERSGFPDDNLFISQFTEKPVYLMTQKNKVYILERFENYDTLECHEVYQCCGAGTYSIEHIMPQHLTPEWKNDLGDDYADIHEKWLHRIANLTLTAYNSKYSNSSFKNKKHMKNGFKESGIRMNTYIASNEQWTSVELEERNARMMEQALKIWEYPTTDYKPIVKQLDYYTLEDDAELFKGRSIVRFSYDNSEQPVTSWVDMYLKVLRILYSEDRDIIMKLAVSSESGISDHFTLDKSKFIKSEEIGDGIYVWTNSDTWSKLSVLNKLFKIYQLDPADLVIYLKDEDADTEGTDSPRFALRERYWSYALGVIKQQFPQDCPFSRINSLQDCLINGATGIGGFHIQCQAQYDKAEVDFVFEKAAMEENKKAFDAVYRYRAEIESSLGVQLIWNRGDDARKSRIAYALENVSIKNETDWIQMANFHAEWSKKIYEVILPYVKSGMDSVDERK